MARPTNTIYKVLEKLILCQPATLDTGCWEWPGWKTNNGYGGVTINRAHCLVHRIVYEFFLGKIPDGLQVDHLCRNRACANPYHMEIVTTRENVLRGIGLSAQNARKTHCHAGHEFSESNTYHYRGQRHCRSCKAATSRGFYLKSRIADGSTTQHVHRSSIEGQD